MRLLQNSYSRALKIAHVCYSSAFLFRLTITTKILFSDVIDGIKLFLNNNPDCYPLILSLENHCSLNFQDAMADSLISILGDSLYIPDEKALFEDLPSPEE